MKKKQTCKQRNHSREPVVGFCFNQYCTEITAFICARCLQRNHSTHLNICYSFNQIKTFFQQSKNKIDDLLLKSASDFKNELEMLQEIKKLLIMIQKIQLEDNEQKALREYVERKLLENGFYEKLLSLWKSLDNYEIKIDDDQLKIQELPTPETDQTIAAQCDKMYNSGKQYYEQDCFGFALECFDNLLKIDPQNSQAYLYKGCILNHLRQYQEAILYFDKALQGDPSNYIALNNQGLSLYFLQNYEEALIRIDRALKINPNESFVLTNKGNILLGLERKMEAIQYYRKAQEIDPENCSFSIQAIIITDQKDAQLEKNDCSPFFSGWLWSKWYSSSHIKKGVLLMKLNLYNQALKYFIKAIALNPYNNESYRFMGFCLLQLKQYEQSLYYLDKAIQIDPQNHEVLDIKGNLLLQMSKIDEAIQCFQAALVIKHHNYNYFRDKRNALILAFQNLWGPQKLIQLDSSRLQNIKEFQTEGSLKTSFIYKRIILKSSEFQLEELNFETKCRYHMI